MSTLQVVNSLLLIGATIFSIYAIRILRQSKKVKNDIRPHEKFNSPTLPSEQKEDKQYMTIYEFVQQVLGLPSEFGFISALASGVILCIVLALILRFFVGGIAQIFYK